MLNKCFALSAVTALSLASAAIPAVAASSWVDVRANAPVIAWNTTAGMAADKDVLGPKGNKVGRVMEILGPDRTTATVAVVDFNGFEGYRAGRVAIPLEQFTLADGILTLRSSASEVMALPVWNS